VRRKLVKYFICMISAAILLTMILMAALAYRLFEYRVLEDLRIEARIAAHVADTEGIEQVRLLLEDDLRLTLIDPSGVVLYDNAAELEGLDNHASRPEVAAALLQGEGTDVRRSDTMDRSTYYYALRLEDGRILRIAEEAFSVLSIYSQTAPAAMLAVILMTGLCVVVANIITRRLVRPIEQMTDHLGDEIREATYPELKPFMRMIDRQHQEILRSADVRIQFTANVSHELKTPLTSISGYAELIESGMAGQEQAKSFAGEIRKSAERLLTLINDIIRLSQMDSPAMALNLEWVDLGQVAEETVAHLRIAAEKMNVTLVTDVHSARIRADRQMMEELVHNLCDNAIRYNVIGGSVRVQVRSHRDTVMLCVQDSGIGIPKEHRDRVFERFYRVDKSRSKATGGTGLGLAIVKHIAAQHGASIHVESEPGQGTMITVCFGADIQEVRGDRVC